MRENFRGKLVSQFSFTILAYNYVYVTVLKNIEMQMSAHSNGMNFKMLIKIRYMKYSTLSGFVIYV